MEYIMNTIQVKGGKKYQKDIAEETVWWCLGYFDIDDVNIRVKIEPYKDCWGTCSEGNKEQSYDITVVNNQSLRDFIATVVHEMVHVKQYVKNRWKGDGEEEAERLQYKLTDKLWKEDTIWN